MKSLFGKILAGAMGFAAAVSMTAFAAATIDTADVKVEVDKTAKSVVVSGKIAGLDAAANGQATILVLPSDKSLAEDFADADIMHIDQDSINADGSFEFSFTLNDTLIKDNKVFNVYCGGTDVTAPYSGNGKIDLTPEAAASFKLVGKVTVLQGADAGKVVAQIKNTTTKANAVAGTGDEKNVGTYTLTVDKAGQYTVVVGREGYLYREIAVNATDAETTVPETVLLAGDVDSNSDIDLKDLQPLLTAYGNAEKYNDKVDFNDDNEIDLKDLQSLLTNWAKTAEAYN